MDYHPSTVYVRDFERERLGDACTGRVERHDDRAVLEIRDGAEDRGHLAAAQDHWKFLWLLGVRNVLDYLRPTQAGAIKEAQGADGLVELRPGTLLRLDKKQLKLADLGRTQLVGRAAEELGYSVDVNFYRPWRVVADREILDHSLA